MKAKSGFTLVEILIVVVILGILAAIVIPQFIDASTQAQESSLAADLQTLRSQIELYKVQHKDQYPDQAPVGFLAALTTQTDRDGNAYVAGVSPSGPYGPYMRKVAQNSFNDLDTVRMDGAAAGANTDGWRYDTTTANIQPDDDFDSDGDGVADHSLL